MINTALIIGLGEVGKAHWEVLKKAYPGLIYYKDIGPEIYDTFGESWPYDGADLLIIATRCDPKQMSDYYRMVKHYDDMYLPRVIDIITTTPIGSCDELQDMLVGEVYVNRSSIRGMHPNLDKFLLDIPKHIGGPNAEELKQFYEKAGIECITHKKTRTVEACHLLNNFIYGVNVMAADECAKYCREYGVDYMEFLEYRKTNNEGFIKSGHPSKVSPILYPSGGSIGGHCVKYAPTTIREDIKGSLAKMLESYGTN